MTLATNLAELVILGLATAAVAITITKSHFFASARFWVSEKNLWLGELFACPYCMGHWIALVFVAIYRPAVFSCGVAPIDWIISWLAVIALSAMFGGLIYRAYR